jgi:hypothetical protein
MEGSDCFNPPVNCSNDMLTLPILEYDHSLGCSISGGYRYRGNENPGLLGVYFYGDFCTGRIWGATENNAGKWTTTVLLDTDLSITTFGEDENGEIYLAHFSSGDGTIYRISEVADPPSSGGGGGDSGGGGGGGCFISTAVNGNT